MQPGDKDGYGRYGYLDTIDGKVLCHECGGVYASVGVHVGRAHGMTADEYREAHGLPQRVKLISPSTKAALSKHSTERVGSEAWERLIEKRDPTAASHSRGRDGFTRRGTDIARQKTVATENIRGARKPVTRRCAACGALLKGVKGRTTCSPLCRRIETYRAKSTAPAEKWAALHDEGCSWSEIGRAFGVTHTNVRNTVRRYGEYLGDVAFLAEHGPGEVPEKRT